MQVGINVAALRWDDDFSILPSIARRCSADGVEFPIQLWQLGGATSQLLGSLPVWSLSGLLHRTQILPESLLAEEAVWQGQLDLINAKCQAAVELGRPSFALCIDPWSTRPRAEALSVFMKRARHCAEIASQYGLQLNLEYVSHRVARANGDGGPYLFCGSLADARRLIRELEFSGVRLLLDLIHWYADGCVEDLPSLTAEIGLVHLADHRATDPDQMCDASRVFPFEGRLPVDRFIAELRAGGYIGPWVIEIFAANDKEIEPRLSQSIDRIRRGYI